MFSSCTFQQRAHCFSRSLSGSCFVLCEQPSQSHPSKSLLYTPACLPTLANESGTEGGAPGMFCKHFRTLAMSRSFGHLHPVGRPPHGHPLWGSETKAMELRYGARRGEGALRLHSLFWPPLSITVLGPRLGKNEIAKEINWGILWRKQTSTSGLNIKW